MPEHTTWFAFLPNYQHFATLLQTWAGPTWVNHSDLDIQHTLGALLVALILVLIALALRSTLKDEKRAIIPDDRFTLRNFIELIAEIVLGYMEEIMGKKASRYFFPLIGTCAFFILFSNVMGFVPGLIPPTSNLNTTAGCSVIIFISTHVFGFREHGIRYLGHFFGPIKPTLAWHMPLVLLLCAFMFVVEIIGHLARPVSLSMRLMGNMFADHAVVGVFLLLVPLVVPVPLMLLGLLVCIVQTLVFCLLSMVYIGSAIAHEEH
jgi:F-type H+-transporting ATPase subunit a